MTSLFHLANILLDGVILWITIFGIGNWIWSLRRSGDEQFTLPSILASLLIGATTLSVLCWWAGVLGFYTQTFAVILSLVAIPLSIKQTFLFKRYIQKPGQEFKTDLAIIILLLPTFIYSFRTPLVAGDAFYSWNTWTLHWATRTDLSDYLFAGYGQWMPVFLSFIYKVKNSGSDIVSDEAFFNHFLFCIFSCLMFLTLKRTISKLSGFSPIVSLLLTTVLACQIEVARMLSIGIVEPFLLCFSALILHEVISDFKRTSFSYNSFLPLGILLGGFAFTKSTGALWAMMLIFIWPLFHKNWALPTKQKWLMVLSSLLLILLLIAAPFYLQQAHVFGNAHIGNPQNHSGSITGMLSGLRKFTQSIKDANHWNHPLEGFLLIFQTTWDYELFPVLSHVGNWLRGLLFLFFLATGVFTNRWSFALGLASLIAYSLWWKYASYGVYNLAASLPIWIILFTLGLRKYFTQINKKAAATIAVLLSLYCINYQIYYLKLVYPGWRNPLFLALSHEDRLNIFFKEAAPAVLELRRLHKEDLDTSKPEKIVFLGGAIGSRLSTNTAPAEFALGELHETQNGLEFQKMIANIKNESLSIQNEKYFDGSVTINGTSYIRPAKRFFKQTLNLRESDIELLLRINAPLSSLNNLIKIKKMTEKIPSCHFYFDNGYGVVKYDSAWYARIYCDQKNNQINSMNKVLKLIHETLAINRSEISFFQN